MLERMHSGTTHVGKVPSKVLSRTQIRRKVEKISQELNAAIEEERYEDAARLRDELKEVKEESSLVCATPKGETHCLLVLVFV